MISILFAEDENANKSSWRRQLAHECEVRFAPSGEEALIEIAEREFDMIAADYSMAGMTGLELLTMVQYLRPKAVRVLLADQTQADVAVRGAGVAHRVLHKPLDQADLAVAIFRTFELEQRLCDPDLQDAIGRIGSLPSPRGSVLRLNDIFNWEEISLDEVAEVVGSDAAMTAKLLQVVNSAYFGLPREVSEIREAISFLGLDAVRNLGVAMELMSSLSPASSLVQPSIEEIHEHSLTMAHVARELLPDRNRANEAFVAALLHGVGELAVASQMPERYLELKVQKMRSNLSAREVEMEVLGAHQSDIGAHLLDLWGLPYDIVEAVARHDEAESIASSGMEIVHAVHIADCLVSSQASSKGEWQQSSSLDPDYLTRVGMTDKVGSFAD